MKVINRAGIQNSSVHVETTFISYFTIFIYWEIISGQFYNITTVFIAMFYFFGSIVNSDRCCVATVAASVYSSLFGNFYGSAFCYL